MACGLLIDIWKGALHQSLCCCGACEANFFIQSMRVAGKERPAPQALQVGMRHNTFHEPDAQSLPAICLKDKNIAQIGKGGKVADDAGKANLLSPLIDTKHQRMLDRAL